MLGAILVPKFTEKFHVAVNHLFIGFVAFAGL
jgi:hypothetical protein